MIDSHQNNYFDCKEYCNVCGPLINCCCGRSNQLTEYPQQIGPFTDEKFSNWNLPSFLEKTNAPRTKTNNSHSGTSKNPKESSNREEVGANEKRAKTVNDPKGSEKGVSENGETQAANDAVNPNVYDSNNEAQAIAGHSKDPTGYGVGAQPDNGTEPILSYGVAPMPSHIFHNECAPMPFHLPYSCPGNRMPMLNPSQMPAAGLPTRKQPLFDPCTGREIVNPSSGGPVGISATPTFQSYGNVQPWYWPVQGFPNACADTQEQSGPGEKNGECSQPCEDLSAQLREQPSNQKEGSQNGKEKEQVKEQTKGQQGQRKERQNEQKKQQFEEQPKGQRKDHRSEPKQQFQPRIQRNTQTQSTLPAKNLTEKSKGESRASQSLAINNEGFIPPRPRRLPRLEEHQVTRRRSLSEGMQEARIVNCSDADRDLIERICNSLQVPRPPDNCYILLPVTMAPPKDKSKEQHNDNPTKDNERYAKEAEKVHREQRAHRQPNEQGNPTVTEKGNRTEKQKNPKAAESEKRIQDARQNQPSEQNKPKEAESRSLRNCACNTIISGNLETHNTGRSDQTEQLPATNESTINLPNSSCCPSPYYAYYYNPYTGRYCWYPSYCCCNGGAATFSLPTASPQEPNLEKDNRNKSNTEENQQRFEAGACIPDSCQWGTYQSNEINPVLAANMTNQIHTPTQLSPVKERYPGRS